MDPTTMTAWLIGLTVLVVALTVLVALDLKRHWDRTASHLARRLVANAMAEAELEALVTGSQEIVRPAPTAEPVTEPERPPTGAAGASLFEEDKTGDRLPPWRTGVPVHRGQLAAVGVPDYGPRPSDLLVGPPMVGNDTLRDWLIHYRQTPETWAEVVAEFYSRAAGVPEVADYFVGVDWPRLKNHFMATLVIITHTGVIRAMPARMSTLHRDVRNSEGQPITEPIFDAVIGTLVDVLRDFGAPQSALDQLGATVAPFRAALVRVPKETTS